MSEKQEIKKQKKTSKFSKNFQKNMGQFEIMDDELLQIQQENKKIQDSLIQKVQSIEEILLEREKRKSEKQKKKEEEEAQKLKQIEEDNNKQKIAIETAKPKNENVHPFFNFYKK